MRRVATTLALVVVLLVAFSATAFAAPEGTTAISPEISDTLIAGEPHELPNTEWVTLDWTLPTGTITVNDPVEIQTTATRNHADSIDRVMYVIEVMKGGVKATAADVEATISGQDGAGNTTMENIPIPLDESGDFWYIGDREIGFTLSATNVANTIKVTFKTVGTYTITAYAVQIDAT